MARHGHHASFDGSITLALGGNTNGAVLGGNVTATAVKGVATFTGLTINKPGSFTIVGEGGGISSSPVMINVAAATPSPHYEGRATQLR
jgi:hypothetical protein